jgi:hypothetical protein
MQEQGMIRFMVPVKTKNPLNGAQGRSRGAVFAKAARRKREREAAALCFKAEATMLVCVRAEVTLTRLSAGKLDGDGLQAALKSVRDGIADALGVNDGSDAVVWKYEQRKCKRGEFGVEVSIE